MILFFTWRHKSSSTLFFLGGGVDCELLTISWVGVSARVDSACGGELQLKTPMSRGMSTSLTEKEKDGCGVEMEEKMQKTQREGENINHGLMVNK